MAKNSGSRPAPKPSSNTAIQKRIESAQANARRAQAKVDLEVAKATVAGKRVEWDYSGPGAPKIKVKG